MLFVVSGPWGVGKSESIKYMSDNYGFMSLIPWTTKITDIGNRGTKYNLLLHAENGKYMEYTEEQLKKFSEYFVCPYKSNNTDCSKQNINAEIGFWCQPFRNSQEYQVLGYRVDEIMDKSNQNAVIIEADTDVASQLKIASQQGVIGRVINIFLDYETVTCFKERLSDEQNYSAHERYLKCNHRKKEIEYYENNKDDIFDHYISANSINIILQEIVKYTTKFIRETPNMLHKKPGPLGSFDIRRALESNDINIKINNNYKKINSYFRKNVYSKQGLNPNYVNNASIDLFLSPECKIMNNNNIDLIDFVMGDKTRLFSLLESKQISPYNISDKYFENVCKIVHKGRKTTIKNLFKDKEIDLRDGLKINPNEIVFCYSLEEIELNDNIIAFITSKLSFSLLGLSITLSQNILQTGHKGKVMLQLKNNLPYPIVIYPYMKIAQIVFFRTISNSSINSRKIITLPRYDESKAFEELSKEIIDNKNFKEIFQKEYNKAKEKKKTKEAKVRYQNYIMLIAICSFLVSLISLILSVILP